MSAVIELTQKERAEIRKREFERLKGEPLFVLEALDESHSWHKAYASNDAIALVREIDRILDDYLERCGFYQEAEQEVLSSKSVNGERYYEV